MLRVLIPYGTTEGLTARISEYVADVVRGQDHEADARTSRAQKPQQLWTATTR